MMGQLLCAAVMPVMPVWRGVCGVCAGRGGVVCWHGGATQPPPRSTSATHPLAATQRFHLGSGPLWLRLTYVTPVLITK
jgi:hypothetical protein